MKKYIKNGKECVLCHTRKKLIQITPEELIRQEFVLKLKNEYKVPLELIDVEVPLSYYQKGKQGRVDIIVSGYDEEHHQKIPLLIVECKAPSVEITEKVFEQIMYYDTFLEPLVMVMTNGCETLIYTWDHSEERYREVQSIPVYKDLISGLPLTYIEQASDHWDKQNHLGDIHSNLDFLKSEGAIGDDSDAKWVSLVMNMYNLLYDDSETAKDLKLAEKLFISDGGLRYTTFGNAGGGSFTGDYRYFMIENSNGETELVSISIMGKMSTRNHPKWKNSNGFTLINLAIDNLEKSHLSLEYAIDRFVKVTGHKYSFWHDGTLTAGKKGRVKNELVLDYIQLRMPHLIKNNQIYLGTLDNSKPFTWEQNEVLQLFSNFIDDAMIRDEFRNNYIS
ncbi:Type I restriction enzyme R protein N terminus (HSDR_N) [Pustulibacterium marinum]|uniref:Type I restriction enzyme R protein N terminus (HSDR_N) n=1 Tax=Pustulibacterium marinum TaxID=1224947 RepID=A0A1I7IZS6_9FLAO|nr:type I restriction enzyme HsdR N-terminal domain-containing protein [Pustulibacterium marinum]SFU78428.1 Type I restriction enzyme R protein N terminus (HSDR_N) [Pustulibacterium marinum]